MKHLKRMKMKVKVKIHIEKNQEMRQLKKNI